MRTFIRFLCAAGALTGAALAQSDNAAQRAIERANAHLAQLRADYGVAGPDYEIRERKASASAGQWHVRYDEYYKGVKVFEGEAVVHVKANGDAETTNSLHGNLNLDVRPSMAQGQARAATIRDLGLRGPADVDVSLEILPQGDRSASDRLVWHVKAVFENELDGPGEFDLFYDAQSGALVWAFNSLETTSYPGTGNTAFAGTVTLPLNYSNGAYSMVNPLQANLKTTDLKNGLFGTGTTFSNASGVFGNGKPDLSDRSTAGADAHFGMTKTWEYFATVFHRNGLNGAGKATYGRVHYWRNYENASWSSSCYCMTYGDGGSTFYPLVSVDVTGHEMAHGVMSSEANLTYSGESGGLNEASSDIFGTMVEYYVNNPSDKPDYWIGERIYRSNWSNGVYTQTKALRYMDNPAQDGKSAACWSSGLGSLDVHYSSGPANHMFWLLAEGGASRCDGSIVTGIGREKASAIWYEAISNWMTASTKYAGARTACLNAAAALYPGDTTVSGAVAAAFSAIKVK